MTSPVGRGEDICSKVDTAHILLADVFVSASDRALRKRPSVTSLAGPNQASQPGFNENKLAPTPTAFGSVPEMLHNGVVDKSGNGVERVQRLHPAYRQLLVSP